MNSTTDLKALERTTEDFHITKSMWAKLGYSEDYMLSNSALFGAMMISLSINRMAAGLEEDVRSLKRDVQEVERAVLRS